MSEITLGAAKRNTESGAIFEAKETARRVEQESERHARDVRELPSPTPASLVMMRRHSQQHVMTRSGCHGVMCRAAIVKHSEESMLKLEGTCQGASLEPGGLHVCSGVFLECGHVPR